MKNTSLEKSEMKKANRKTSKKLLTEKVDHFFWRADYFQGGTSLENARQLPGLIPKLEAEAAEIARLLENAGKLVLEDAHLVRYAGEVVPAKLAAYKAKLPGALELLAKHAKEAPQEPAPPVMAGSSPQGPTSQREASKSPFAPLALFVPESSPQGPTSAEPSDAEIFAALGLLNRANPENVKKILAKFS